MSSAPIVFIEHPIIVAMDMGTKNFSFCIVELSSPPRILELVNHDLTGGKVVKKVIDVHKYLITFLNNYSCYWNSNPTILIEKQLSRNPKAIRLEQTCQTYFLIKYPKSNVISYSSRNKTELLDAPEAMTKYQRKKWSVEKAKQLLLSRDIDSYNKLMEFKKKDDVADCILMIETYLANPKNKK